MGLSLTLADWLAIIAIVVALVAIPLSYLFGKRARQKPDIRFANDFQEVLAPSGWLLSGGLKVSFDGKPVERLHRTILAIWVHRGDTVSESDIVAASPLRISGASTQNEILQARIVSFSRAENALTVDVSEDQSAVIVGFDFLDARDGFVVEVLHTYPAVLDLKGTIKGAEIRRAGRAPLQFWDRAEMSQDRPGFGRGLRWVAPITMLCFSLLIGVPGVVITALNPPKTFASAFTSGESSLGTFLLLLGSAYLVVTLVSFVAKARGRRAMPRRIFNNEAASTPPPERRSRSGGILNFVRDVLQTMF